MVAASEAPQRGGVAGAAWFTAAGVAAPRVGTAWQQRSVSLRAAGPRRVTAGVDSPAENRPGAAGEVRRGGRCRVKPRHGEAGAGGIDRRRRGRSRCGAAGAAANGGHSQAVVWQLRVGWRSTAVARIGSVWQAWTAREARGRPRSARGRRLWSARPRGAKHGRCTAAVESVGVRCGGQARAGGMGSPR